MNELITELALDPIPYRHIVVQREHPIFEDRQFSCVCGWRSHWYSKYGKPCDYMTDHPAGLVTVSRDDWTVIPHPSQVHA